MNPTPTPASRALPVGDVVVPGRVWIAPMTGISDLAFRRAAARAGAAYVATEMVACAELVRGRPDVVRRAAVGEGLPLTVIQLVGADPTLIAQGAKLAEAAGADIVDLNFGCPAKVVTGAACGSALMRDLDAACRLIEAAVSATSRPVTVKMRLGWDQATLNAPELALRAQALGVRAVTVHGRTRQQQYSGRADWGAVAAVKAAVSIPVIVNGDIVDAASAREALRQSGADAVMLGRSVCGAPWRAAAVERALAEGGEAADPAAPERFEVVSRHLRETAAFYGERLGVRVFRKHLAAYVDGGPSPADPDARRGLRARLCRLETVADILDGLAQAWLADAARQAQAA
jgi:nifR3 family TIM-barrel protein